MKIFLIRHGATPGNLEHRYVGKTEEELTKECQEILENLKSSKTCGLIPALQHPSAVYTSPMKRCAMTARLLFPASADSGTERYEIQDFRECDFGSFEYKNHLELSGNAAYQHFIDTLGREGFPGGETTDGFKRRCTEAFQDILSRELEKERVTGEERTLAFVIHGGTIMAILEAFARPKRSYYSWQVKNLEGYQATVQKNPDFCLTDVVKVCIL